jgi:hypothetical protein
MCFEYLQFNKITKLCVTVGTSIVNIILQKKKKKTVHSVIPFYRNGPKMLTAT